MQHTNPPPRLKRGAVSLPARTAALNIPFCIPLIAFLDGADISPRSVDEDDVPTVKLQPKDQTPESVPTPEPKRDESNDEHAVELHIIPEPPPPPSVLGACRRNIPLLKLRHLGRLVSEDIHRLNRDEAQLFVHYVSRIGLLRHAPRRIHQRTSKGWLSHRPGSATDYRKLTHSRDSFLCMVDRRTKCGDWREAVNMPSALSSRNRRIWDYSKPVSDPPKSVSAYDEMGVPISEELLLVGWFLCRDRDWLKSHQIDISYGYYHPRCARFERCLVSLENFRVLQDLQLKGDFQTPFYLTFSLGELCHQELLKTSHISTRPILPEWAYLVHPELENRKKLSLWQEKRRGRLRLVEEAISSP